MERLLIDIETIFADNAADPEAAYRVCHGNLQYRLREGELTSDQAERLAARIDELYVAAQAALDQPPYRLAELVDDTHTLAMQSQQGTACYQYQVVDLEGRRLVRSGRAFDISSDGHVLRYWLGFDRAMVAHLAPDQLPLRTSSRPLKSFTLTLDNGLVMSFERAGFLEGPAEVEIEAQQAAEPPHHPRRVFAGCLLGLAVGDALGAAVENLDASAIARHFPDGLTDFAPGVPGSLLARLPAGTYTDDTVMALGLAEAYVAERGQYVPTAVAARWVEWKKKGPYAELGPGIACDKAIGRLMRGFSPEESGVEGSAGNGGAMRVAPVGLLHHRDPVRCVREAIAQSRITHRHPEADAAAACMALAVAFLVRHHRQPFEAAEFWELMRFEARKHSDAFFVALAEAEAAQVSPINISGYVTETLPAAFRLFLDRRRSFEAAVTAAAGAGGDTDTVAAIVGALAGAYLGVEAIPARWRVALRGRERVDAAALSLASLATPSVRREPQRQPEETPEALEGAWALCYGYQARQREVGHPVPDGVEGLAVHHPDPHALALVLQAEYLIHGDAALQGLHHYQLLGERLHALGEEPWRAVLGPMLERRGYAWYERGAWHEAAWALRLAYELYALTTVPPGHWMAYAGILADAGQWAEAMLLLQGLIKDLTPAAEESAWLRAAIYLTMGNVLDTADDLEGAEVSYRACMEVAYEDVDDPDWQHVQMALTNLGVAYKRRGHRKEALTCFEQALAIEEDDYVKKLKSELATEPGETVALEDGFRLLKTVDRHRPFRVKGSVEEGVTLRFEVGGASFSAEDWQALSKHFASRTEVPLGASRTAPPAGSVGAYLLATKKVNLASYLLPLLIEAGLATASKTGRAVLVHFIEQEG